MNMGKDVVDADKFISPYYYQENLAQYHNLKQGSKTVEEYAREFETMHVVV